MTERATDDLVATFAAETHVRVEAMKRDLLAMEGNAGAAATRGALDGLVREAHSLKDAAGAVGVERVETVAHRLEHLLELVRKGELDLDRAVRAVVLRVLDAISALAREAIANEPAGVDLDTIAAMLDDPARGIIEALPGATETRAAARTPGPVTGATAPIGVAAPVTGDSVRVARSRLEVLRAAVEELEAANSASQRRLGELRRMADEISELLSTTPAVGAGPVDVPPAPGAESAVVLLVENSQTTRTLQKHLLEHAGYEVRAAADGVDAWDVLQGGGIDAVVSDIMMPGMDGFELTARIRADAGLRTLPVILITAVETPERRKRSAEVGADACLVKGPTQHEDLVKTIERLT